MNNLKLLFIFFLYSCQQRESTVDSSIQRTIHPVYVPNSTVKLVVYVIDSCEYLGTEQLISSYALLTHKGNCTNPRHNKK